MMRYVFFFFFFFGATEGSSRKPCYFLLFRQFVNFHFLVQFSIDLINKLSNDRQCSITSYCEEKFMIFMKIQKF